MKSMKNILLGKYMSLQTNSFRTSKGFESFAATAIFTLKKIYKIHRHSGSYHSDSAPAPGGDSYPESPPSKSHTGNFTDAMHDIKAGDSGSFAPPGADALRYANVRTASTPGRRAVDDGKMRIADRKMNISKTKESTLIHFQSSQPNRANRPWITDVATKVAPLMLTIFLTCLSACTNDFEELNTNPNQPEEVSADLLLAQVLTSAANNIALESWGAGNIIAQYSAKINFTDFDRYQWGSNEGFWNSMYGNLRDIYNVLEIARSEESANASYEGIALVMKSWTYNELTSLWGDIPYEEAIRGRGEDPILQPQFTPQEQVFEGILTDLRMANDLIQPDGPAIAGDVIYGGDLSKWKKFANSLRVRILMRISDKQDVAAELQEIVSNEPLMESNEDNALMEYLPSQPNTWPIHTYRVGSFDEYRLSLTMESVLREFNDPRLFLWYRPTDRTINGDDPTYAGMPNGLSENNASTYNGGAQNVSRLGRILYEEPNSVDAVLMQHAELEFLLAEAALQGLISGEAETYYTQGVQASFDYWGLELPAGYLNQPGVTYDGELSTIITQKWLALFLNGYEAWYDYRRTGFPTRITPGPDNVNQNRVPVRFQYPDNQQTLNTENYQTAIANQGEDNINTKTWLLK